MIKLGKVKKKNKPATLFVKMSKTGRVVREELD